MDNIKKEIKVLFRAFISSMKYCGWLIKREVAFYKIKPREALFFLTYRCSCHCKSCVMWKRDKNYKEMDLEGWKRAVDEVAKKDIKVIYLFGGDVFLRKDILAPLAKYIVEKGILCDVVTNGNLVDEDIARQLVESGAYNLGVSIDAIGELHEMMRGVKGIFERATQAVRYMIEARGSSNKPNINIYCTISNLNIDKFHEVLPLARELGVDMLHFELCGEFSKEDCDNSRVDGITSRPYYLRKNESLLLNEDQAHYLKNKLRELESTVPKGRFSIETDHIQCLSVQDMVKGNFQHKRCYLARYHINVDPEGNIIPCLFFPDYKMGNLLETQIENIWANNKHKKFIRDVDCGKVPICKHCIVGIQRNPTFMQALKRRFSEDALNFKRRYLTH